MGRDMSQDMGRDIEDRDMGWNMGQDIGRDMTMSRDMD